MRMPVRHWPGVSLIWSLGTSAMATPPRMTAMQAISGRFSLVPSQSHSMRAVMGGVRHWLISTVRRLPSRGSA